MAIPNMRRTVQRFSFPVTIQTVTESIVNNRPVETISERVVNMNVQPLKPDEITALGYDVSLRYLRIFDFDSQLEQGDRIVHNSKTYIVQPKLDYQDYGFDEVYAEEDKT